MRPARLAFAAALALAPFPGAAVAGASFDAFLSGLDHACKSSTAFEDFWASVNDHYGYSEGERPKIAFPGDLRPAIGTIAATDKGEWVEVTMPLDGTFRGLTLARLTFFVGKENGITGYRVEFAEPPARLKATLGKAVAAGMKRMAAEDTAGVGSSTGFDFAKGASAVFCDFSN